MTNSGLLLVVVGLAVGCGAAPVTQIPVRMPEPVAVQVPQVVVVEDPRTVGRVEDVELDCQAERERSRRAWRAYVAVEHEELVDALSEVAALEVGLAQASVLVMRGVVADAGGAGLDVGALRDLSTTSEEELAAMASELEPLRRAAHGGDTVAAMRLLQRLVVRASQIVQAAGGAAASTRELPRSDQTRLAIEALQRINAEIPAANDRLAREAQIADEAWTIDQAVRTGGIEPWDAFHLIPLPPAASDPLSEARLQAARARTQCTRTPSTTVAARH